MLTTYFTRPATRAGYYAGPVGPYLDPFTDWLVKRGYCKDVIRHLLFGAVGFANWMQVAGGDLTSLHEGVWNTFCDHLAKQGRLHGTKGQHSIYWRGAKQFTEFLRAQQGIVATKAALAPPELVAAFEHWMQIHRGVKPSTLITYRQHVMDLLSSLDPQPEQFNATKLHGFILTYAKRNGRAVAQTRVKAARMFLRFLIATERCQPGLDAAIPTIAE